MKNMMSKNAILLVARVLMSSLFIWSAIGKFSDITGTAAFANMPEFWIWVAAAIELVGGLLILFGGCVHAGAMLLFLYLVVLTILVHLPLTDDVVNSVNFYKNLAIGGGLLALMVAGGGKHQVYRCRCDL